MAFASRTSYIGDGITRTFSIPFPYLAYDHVSILVDGVEDVTKTFPTEGSIQVSVAPPIDSIVTVLRKTPTDRLVDFTDGSILNAGSLNQDSNQMLFLVQESNDTNYGTVNLTVADVFDAQGKRVVNVGDAVEDTDALNKRTLMNILSGTWVIEKDGTDAVGTINFKTYPRA